MVMHVHIRVKKENLDDFISLTLENAHNSILEAGVRQFDFYQQTDDPQKFLLVEIYQDEKGALAHKETDHYARWKAGVEPMMAEPRISIKYTQITPRNAQQGN